MDSVKKENGNTKPKADQYEGLQNSTQTFGGIGLLEAVNGNVVLRGRHGERDHIFTIDKAIEKYYDTVQTVNYYALHGIRGWDTLKDINDCLKAKILEAIQQRKAKPVLGEVSKRALTFEQIEVH